MSAYDKAALCLEIRRSNDIQQICSRIVEPSKLDRPTSPVHEKLKTLFISLYSKVLDGRVFREEMGVTLREHFDAFRLANREITLCPMCGISELKTEYDNTRDQYDHYLPKSIYSYSSVNFFNLVPLCKECNSFDVKGDIDILDVIGTRRLFYPYDTSHRGIEIQFSIVVDQADLDRVQWNIDFTCHDGRNEEIESWNLIYKIDSRYKGFVKGRIAKWFRAYWEFISDPEIAGLSETERKTCYFLVLKKDESECLSVVRRSALQAFLDQSQLARAAREAALYS